MSKQDFLVVGGRQDKGVFRKGEWHRYKEGVVVRVGVGGNTSEVCLEYRSPSEACASDQNPSIVFKAGTLVDDRLYLCTQTEIMVYRLPEFHLLEYVSLPYFNDLHHVRPTPNHSLLAVVTGLDLVMEISYDGAVLREWGVLKQNPWERFSRTEDYRRVLTTKPHLSHPNYVFYLDEQIWTTRFKQKDAICLTAPKSPILIPIEKPHDGSVANGYVYFTTVNGYVVLVDATTRKTAKVVNLNGISDGDWALGWCRGLWVLDERHVIVGFSRLRPTQLRENVRWARYGLGLRETKGNLPTRIVCYDIIDSRELWEIDLEPLGMNAIFSIHPFPQSK